MRGFHSYEKALEEDSFIARAALPRTQALTAEYLGLGNEQVYLGRQGFLFYQPDVVYLTGPGFLNPTVLQKRARSGDSSASKAIQPDPVKAITQFGEQLKDLGIHLIVMPVPVKPMIEPELLSPAYQSPSDSLQNPSYAAFLAAIRKAGIDFLDVSQALADDKRATGQSQFLRTDTHWTPEAMEAAAALLAAKIRALGFTEAVEPLEMIRSTQVIRGEGDITTMLKLPKPSHLFPKETVTIHPVLLPDGKPWSADARAPILVLGDSFFNVFSLAGMGWGASAGFVEQLSYTLREPVDAILRNDAGAFATREILGQELARGRDRLHRKRVVVWEFAMRELASGTWDLVSLKTRAQNETRFLVLRPRERLTAKATIENIGTLPHPGTTPYKDFLTAFHLTKISDEPAKGAIVYLQTMKNHELTPAARLKPGDRISLLLTSWTDAERQYGGVNRGELEDENLLLEEPNFAELVP
jgi:alginate O-acetyltransferase complex protein AlgJ